MTDVTNAVLFHSESKGSGFHANEHPQAYLYNSASGCQGIFRTTVPKMEKMAVLFGLYS